MAVAKKPVAIFCGDSTNRIYAARNWRVQQRIGDRGGIVRVIGHKDDVTRAACVAVAKHRKRCDGCADCDALGLECRDAAKPFSEERTLS